MDFFELLFSRGTPYRDRLSRPLRRVDMGVALILVAITAAVIGLATMTVSSPLLSAADVVAP